MRCPERTSECHGQTSCHCCTDRTGRNHTKRILCCERNGTFCNEGKSHHIVYEAGLTLFLGKFLLEEGGAQGNCDRRNHTACHNRGHHLKVTLCQLCCAKYIGCLVERAAHIDGHHAAEQHTEYNTAGSAHAI